ncbi:hypothetical protein AtubIFM55763_006340 [Aspergillus tubingensis]|nr:hypothetical protein AtubIFM55763_006340 [Aspergillus tubingensis]GLB20959.1 hypothetical protein AtubIFM61612_010907 [Aspergillus tubingensis]
MSLAANSINQSNTRSLSRDNVASRLYATVKREIHLAYLLMKSNFDAASSPFPIFTTASLLHSRATYEKALSSLACATIYGILFHYTIDLANHAEGAENKYEDKINKPDRPIVQSQTTISATKYRFYIVSATWLLLSYSLDLYIWSLLWIVVVIFLYILHASRIGPAKDFCMVLGTLSQLMACWKLGGSDSVDSAWRWVVPIMVWVFFTIPIQDFRDVPGDLASGRKTTPILLGDVPGM